MIRFTLDEEVKLTVRHLGLVPLDAQAGDIEPLNTGRLAGQLRLRRLQARWRVPLFAGSGMRRDVARGPRR